MTARPACTRVRVRADEDGLARVFHTYDRFVHRHDVPDDVRRDVYVALEEIVSNVSRHAGAARAAHVGVTLMIDRGTLRVRIVDDGPAFDPFSAPEFDVTQTLEDRPVGGLGVLLVKKLTDEHSYSRRGQYNRVVLSKALAIEH
jgi:anti-sigma regulatory factor (Ser/Thr protein kinase)